MWTEAQAPPKRDPALAAAASNRFHFLPRRQMSSWSLYSLDSVSAAICRHPLASQPPCSGSTAAPLRSRCFAGECVADIPYLRDFSHCYGGLEAAAVSLTPVVVKRCRNFGFSRWTISRSEQRNGPNDEETQRKHFERPKDRKRVIECNKKHDVVCKQVQMFPSLCL